MRVVCRPQVLAALLVFLFSIDFAQPNEFVLITPGQGVGLLKLGDTRQRVIELFPYKKNIDQEFECLECGVEYLWVDIKNTRKGNVLIRMRDGLVFQIESATTRFHTPDGLTSFSSPQQVQRHYKALRAYFLRGRFSEAVGGRSLVFWVDRGRGIAFAFAFDRDRKERYVYKIIVFEPKKQFCPEGETTDSENWVELPPYALDPVEERIGR